MAQWDLFLSLNNCASCSSAHDFGIWDQIQITPLLLANAGQAWDHYPGLPQPQQVESRIPKELVQPQGWSQQLADYASQSHDCPGVSHRASEAGCMVGTLTYINFKV